jgi:hypothetical protein
MTNTIDLATRFQPILDEVYKKASITSFLDAKTKPIDNGGVAEVKIFKISAVGLGTYSRATGFPVGDVNGSWETIQLTAERGREFNIDDMDDEETLGMAFGALVGEFIRVYVAPEVDAFRFARWASWSGIGGTTGTLSAGTVLAAIDAAVAVLDAAEVPSEGRILFVSPVVSGYINQAITRTLANETGVERRVKTLDGLQIIVVPQTRFYDEITLNAGASSSAGGYVVTPSTGQEINFMLMAPGARDQATKTAKLKIFTPQENQEMDAWKFQYRIYHDTWVYDNKKAGIYVHKKA